MKCTMCGERRATKSYGLPVCRSCHKMLHRIQGELQDMEAVDPELKRLGENVERSARKYLDERD